MPTYNIHEAKTRLSELITAAQQGEAVIIVSAGTPVAVLRPIRVVAPKRVRGVLKGQIKLGPAFDEPLPAHVLEGL